MRVSDRPERNPGRSGYSALPSRDGPGSINLDFSQADPSEGDEDPADTPAILAFDADPRARRSPIDLTLLDPGENGSQRLRSLQIINTELEHRLRNIIALVLSASRIAAEHSSTVQEFRETFEDRIRAIVDADRVVRASGKAVSLVTMVRRTIAPYCRTGQLALSGPDVTLCVGDALDISMIMHELTTNAVKHGALSCREGIVSVRWQVQVLKSRAMLRFEWSERGGPSLTGRTRRGFGSTILCHRGKAITGGAARLVFATSGLRYVLTTPWQPSPVDRRS